MENEKKSNQKYIEIEVKSEDHLTRLEKKFNEFFPDQIIRLIIDGTMSNLFYLGKSKWMRSNKQYIVQHKAVEHTLSDTKPDEIIFKIMFNQKPEDVFENIQLNLFKNLNIDIQKYRIIKDITFCGKKFIGLIISDGNTLILDQKLFLNIEEFLEEFGKNLKYEIIIDILNSNKSGLIVIKTNKCLYEEIGDIQI